MIRQRNTQTSLDVLRPLPLFEGWPDADIAMLALAADVLWLRQPHALLQEGAIPYEFFVLLNGEAVVTAGGSLVAVIGRGTVVGADTLMAGIASQVSVVTTGAARVLAFGPRAIEQLERRTAQAELLRAV